MQAHAGGRSLGSGDQKPLPRIASEDLDLGMPFVKIPTPRVNAGNELLHGAYARPPGGFSSWIAREWSVL